MMNKHIEKFGELPSGEIINLITLSLCNGASMKVMNYGAKLVSLVIPDKDKNLVDVVLGYKTFEDYLNGHRFFGSNPGPYANRIRNASFEIDGIKYQFQANAGKHLLHSGERALESVVWNYKIGGDYIKFTYRCREGEFGFPGNRNITIIYHWDDKLKLTIEYKATTDKATHLNLTHHSYFNLEGECSDSVLDHVISINASQFLETDEESIPTGNMLDVKDTPLNLLSGKRIGDVIFADFPVLRNTLGFDQCYIINRKEKELTHCARVISPKNGCSMDVYSTLPGMQFYTDNHDNGATIGKCGKAYPIQSALCLEPQYFPNSPNIPSFPDTLLRPGNEYNETIIYHFNQS